MDNSTYEDFKHLVHASTLEFWKTQPFLLKMDYHLFDLNGKPVQDGILEEQWGNYEPPKIHVESPSLKLNGLYGAPETPETHNRESYLVNQILQSITRPFPTLLNQADFVEDFFEQTIDSETMQCFAFVPPGKRTDTTSSYCRDSTGRLVALTGGGSYLLQRKNFKKYRDREVPLDLSLSYGGKMAITAHVTELDLLSTKKEVPPSSNKASPQETHIPGGVIASLIIKKVNPKYPKEAKKKHLGGTVLLTAVINKEGKISCLDVIASPDLMLSQAATEAVHQWTYKPYLLHGEPTEVDTTITVNFNLNGN